MELPKLLVDGAQVIGSALSLLALVLALLALWVGRRDLRRERHDQLVERRRIHELEILRRIGLALGSESASAEKEEIATLLMLLPPREDFPLTRAALQVWPRMEGTQELVTQIRYELRHLAEQAPDQQVPHYWSPDVRWRFVAQRRRSFDRSVIRDELNVAISARIVDPSTGLPMTFGREPILPTLTRHEPALPGPDQVLPRR